jgi:hypothetical protein
MKYLDFGTRENLKVFHQFQFLRKKLNFMSFNLNYINRTGIHRQTLFGNLALKISILLKRA